MLCSEIGLMPLLCAGRAGDRGFRLARRSESICHSPPTKNHGVNPCLTSSPYPDRLVVHDVSAGLEQNELQGYPSENAMINHTLDTVNSILYVRPVSSLEKSDFSQLAETVDPFIESSGNLKALIIDAPTFPGWHSFGSLAAHIRFVRDHHRHIHKVALVTDSVLGDVAEHLAGHFVAAEIKHFAGADLEAAKQWATSP